MSPFMTGLLAFTILNLCLQVVTSASSNSNKISKMIDTKLDRDIHSKLSTLNKRDKIIFLLKLLQKQLTTDDDIDLITNEDSEKKSKPTQPQLDNVNIQGDITTNTTTEILYNPVESTSKLPLISLNNKIQSISATESTFSKTNDIGTISNLSDIELDSSEIKHSYKLTIPEVRTSGSPTTKNTIEDYHHQELLKVHPSQQSSPSDKNLSVSTEIDQEISEITTNFTKSIRNNELNIEEKSNDNITTIEKPERQSDIKNEFKTIYAPITKPNSPSNIPVSTESIPALGNLVMNMKKDVGEPNIQTLQHSLSEASNNDSNRFTITESNVSISKSNLIEPIAQSTKNSSELSSEVKNTEKNDVNKSSAQTAKSQSDKTTGSDLSNPAKQDSNVSHTEPINQLTPAKNSDLHTKYYEINNVSESTNQEVKHLYNIITSENKLSSQTTQPNNHSSEPITHNQNSGLKTEKKYASEPTVQVLEPPSIITGEDEPTDPNSHTSKPNLIDSMTPNKNEALKAENNKLNNVSKSTIQVTNHSSNIARKSKPSSPTTEPNNYSGEPVTHNQYSGSKIEKNDAGEPTVQVLEPQSIITSEDKPRRPTTEPNSHTSKPNLIDPITRHKNVALKAENNKLNNVSESTFQVTNHSSNIARKSKPSSPTTEPNNYSGEPITHNQYSGSKTEKNDASEPTVQVLEPQSIITSADEPRRPTTEPNSHTSKPNLIDPITSNKNVLLQAENNKINNVTESITIQASLTDRKINSEANSPTITGSNTDISELNSIELLTPSAKNLDLNTANDKKNCASEPIVQTLHQSEINIEKKTSNSTTTIKLNSLQTDIASWILSANQLVTKPQGEPQKLKMLMMLFD